MKSIKYLFVTALVCITMISSLCKAQGVERTLLLQLVDSNVSTQLLKQSADIISARLTACRISSFYLSINEDKGQIKIEMPDSIDFPEIEFLLTAKGSLAFYETCSGDELTKLLKDNRLTDMVNISVQGKGCVPVGKVDMVNKCIGSYGHIKGCILCWGMSEDKANACFYALKVDTNGSPLLVRSDIEAVTYSQEDRLELTFAPSGAKIFAEATAKNVGRLIAIVIDDKVISAPLIRDAITGGKCEISGAFTKNGTDFLLALVNNNPLPLNFKIIK
jgi:hypothetical protein